MADHSQGVSKTKEDIDAVDATMKNRRDELQKELDEHRREAETARGYSTQFLHKTGVAEAALATGHAVDEDNRAKKLQEQIKELDRKMKKMKNQSPSMTTRAKKEASKGQGLY